MRMGQGVRTGLGHGGITCVLQTQFSSFYFKLQIETKQKEAKWAAALQEPYCWKPYTTNIKNV